MDFNILGPFDVRDREGREVRLPTGRERSLLALLLIHGGEVVSIDRIVDALWGEHPPGTAAKAVQGYVSHLRRVLPADDERGEAGTPLVTRPPGYALRTANITLDATRFERLAGDGRRALEDGSADEAARLLGDALALWRGPALQEFAFDDFAQAEIRRLEELRLSATEDRIDAHLELGRHGELVAQLESLVAAHPLRERLRGQLMQALYRGGRQADALTVYREGRRLLATELGLEPGPELQRLERAILAQDPTLESTTHAPAPPSPLEPPPGEPPPAAPRRRVPRRLVPLGVLAVAVAAALLAVALTRGDDAPSVAVVPPAVVAVDPQTNRVVASITVGSKPAAIAGGQGAVWVGDARDGTVTRIDPERRSVVKTIGIGAPAIDLAAGVGSVWVATGGFGSIVRLDAELGVVTDRIELREPGDPVVPAVTSVAVGGGWLWAGAFDGLLRIDPDSSEVTARVDLGDAAALQIATGGGAVWATTFKNRAKRIAVSSAQETTEFYAGSSVFPIVLDRTAVWVGGYGGQLWKVDPVTGTLLDTSRVGASPTGIALGDGAVWVASWGERALVRIDPVTGDVEATVPIEGRPEDVAFHAGLVWVVVQKPARSTP